jgi:hypothetical protein
MASTTAPQLSETHDALDVGIARYEPDGGRIRDGNAPIPDAEIDSIYDHEHHPRLRRWPVRDAVVRRVPRRRDRVRAAALRR